MVFLVMRFLKKKNPDWINNWHYEFKPTKWMWIHLWEMSEFILRFQTFQGRLALYFCSFYLLMLFRSTDMKTHMGLKVINDCVEQYDPTHSEEVKKMWAHCICCVNANPSRCFPDNSEGLPTHLSIIHCTKTKALNFKRTSKDIQTIAVIVCWVCMFLEDTSCLTWLFT